MQEDNDGSGGSSFELYNGLSFVSMVETTIVRWYYYKLHRNMVLNESYW